MVESSVRSEGKKKKDRRVLLSITATHQLAQQSILHDFHVHQTFNISKSTNFPVACSPDELYYESVQASRWLQV